MLTGFLEIYGNFFRGRRAKGIAVMAVLLAMGMIQFVIYHLIVVGLLLNLFVYGLLLPAFIYAFDFDAKANPGTPKTWRNFLRIVSGNGSK